MEQKIEHEFHDVSAGLGDPDLRLGTYDIVQSEMVVLEDKIIFRHRVSLKYGPPPKVIDINPAGEANRGGG